MMRDRVCTRSFSTRHLDIVMQSSRTQKPIASLSNTAQSSISWKNCHLSSYNYYYYWLYQLLKFVIPNNIRIISKDHNWDPCYKKQEIWLLFEKPARFCNIFSAHCTTIMLPTTATTSEATHCRLSDNIPIIMESTMTTTSKSFFSVFAMAPIQFHTHLFYY